MTRVRKILKRRRRDGNHQESGVRSPSFALLGALLILAGTVLAQDSRPTVGGVPAVLFEPNLGQFSKNVLFEARTRIGKVHGLADGLLVSLSNSKRAAAAFIHFLDTNDGLPDVEMQSMTPCRVNRYRGRGAANRFEAIPTYRSVRLHGVYPGVDLDYRDGGGMIAFDFRVEPYVPIYVVRFRVSGDAIRAEISDGELLIRVGNEPLLRLTPPLTFQPTRNRYVRRDSRFVECAPGVFGFVVRDRAIDLPVVVDPVAVFFATFLGGGSPYYADFGRGVALGNQGTAYVAGEEYGALFVPTGVPLTNHPSINFPGGNPTIAPLIVVVKYSPAGMPQWITQFSGNGGETVGGLDHIPGHGVFVVGTTHTPGNFPSMNSGLPPLSTAFTNTEDVLVLRLHENNGIVLTAAAFGGNRQDWGRGIAVNAAGTHAYVTGQSDSANLAPPGFLTLYGSAGVGNVDAFVVSLDFSTPTVTMRYATYLGGTGFDVGRDIALDGQENVYIVGQASSSTLQTPGAARFTNSFLPGMSHSSSAGSDAFIAGFSFPSGVLTHDFTSFFGGGVAASAAQSPEDLGYGIAVDATGAKIVITGETMATDLPTTFPVLRGTFAGGMSDAFAASFSFQRFGGAAPDVLDLRWATYLGGTGDDMGRAVALDMNGDVHLCGLTGSADFPVVNAVQGASGGLTDVFVGKLSAAGGTLLWSTYWGGTEDERAWAIDTSPDGNRTVITGVAFRSPLSTSSFPVLNAAQPAFSGGFGDGVVISLGEPQIDIQPTAINFGKTAVGTMTTATLTISNLGVANLILNALSAGPLNQTGEFSVLGGIAAGTTITPGNRMKLTVAFAPPAPGTTYRHVLLLGSDDPDRPTVAISLTGES